ncbi:MAG: gamma-glutamyltransferase, partial [Dehalococcoidia bacterium]
ASVGVDILKSGGNAFDAALAVAAAEAVTVTPMCGLGGDVFAILYQASTGRVYGISSSGVEATGTTPQFFRSQGYTTMPLRGPLAVSVPGEVAAWEELHRSFCTKPFAQLLDSAIGYAAEGFPVAPGIARSFQRATNKLTQFASSAAVYAPQGTTPSEGDILINSDLANSLRRVAQGGADEFYRGSLAKEMVQGLNAYGGVFTEADFARHQHEVYDPITTTYRDHVIYQTQPPSQGFLTLEMLNLVEDFDLAQLGQNSTEAIHLMVEAKKIAYDDRNRLAGDPRFVEWPLYELISKESAPRRRRDSDPHRANNHQATKQAVDGDGNTTYFCAADGAGNCISWIHSLSNGFGSGLVAPGTGVLFNNRAGRGFSLASNHPNIIEPGKRTMHTLNCYMTLKDGQPAIVGGTPGGDFQPQCGLQILSNLIDHHMDPQAAVEAPRWWSFPGTDPESLEQPLELRVEAGMPEETIKALAELGHRVAPRSAGTTDGIVQLILRDPETGVLRGASDPRGDGHAAAW